MKLIYQKKDERSYRAVRGGSWYNNAQNCRSANRNNSSPGYRYNSLGLRPARSKKGVEE